MGYDIIQRQTLLDLLSEATAGGLQLNGPQASVSFLQLPISLRLIIFARLLQLPS